MDPTPLNPPKSHRHRNRHHHPHPLPDPTILPPSTIQNISHRFSKLYANHKKSSSKPPNGSRYIHQPPHPEPETDFQINPPVLDTSCTTLTKSKSQHEGKPNSQNLSVVKVVKVKGADDIKKPSNQNDLKNPSNQKDLKKPSLNDFDVKKASQLMSKSLEVRGEAVEVRRPSVSSIPPMVNGRRRKSFCSSQADLADFFSGTGVKVVAVDMPPFMQIHAVDCARKTHDSLEKFTSKSLALTLKKEFDGVYGPAWHCIVGTSFGSFVTHSVGGFMYFSMDQKLYVLLFKTTVQRAAAE